MSKLYSLRRESGSGGRNLAASQGEAGGTAQHAGQLAGLTGNKGVRTEALQRPDFPCLPSPRGRARCSLSLTEQAT